MKTWEGQISTMNFRDAGKNGEVKGEYGDVDQHHAHAHGADGGRSNCQHTDDPSYVGGKDSIQWKKTHGRVRRPNTLRIPFYWSGCGVGKACMIVI